MTSKQAKWDWTPECQHAFDEIKTVVSRETLLSYPDFNKPFEIHTDASKLQLGAVISQKGKPVAFYSRKLNPAQVNYTTTEREILSISLCMDDLFAGFEYVRAYIDDLIVISNGTFDDHYKQQALK